MTDANGATDIGNPETTETQQGQGQPPEAVDHFAELDEATRDWVKTRHEGNITKLAKQAFELDKFAGSAIQLPKADATPEELGKFYQKLGRPDTADKYELTVPKDMPENLPYDEDTAKWFRDMAFEKGLTQAQAAALHDEFVAKQVSMAEGFGATMTDNVKSVVDKANTDLQAAWGDPKGETYKANLEMAGRFFDAIDEDGSLQGELAKAGLVGPEGEVLVSALAKGFAKAGMALFTEGGTLSETSDSLNGVNPFAEGGNLTDAMKVVKADPDKARTLIKVAGADPKSYGL